MHNVEKWPNIHLKYCGNHIATFLKYVWPVFSIMHERANQFFIRFPFSFITFHHFAAKDILFILESLMEKGEHKCKIGLAIAYQIGICLIKVNNEKTRIMCDIWLKLNTKITETRQRLRSGVFILNIEHISHII